MRLVKSPYPVRRLKATPEQEIAQLRTILIEMGGYMRGLPLLVEKLVRERVAKIPTIPGAPGRPGRDAQPPSISEVARVAAGMISVSTPKEAEPVDTEKLSAEILAQVLEQLEEKGVDKKWLEEEFEKLSKKLHGSLKRDVKISDIEGLEQTLGAVRNLAAKGGVRGGGDTVAAGAGITITQNNGVKTITALGSSPDVATESLSPTASGDNVTLDLTGLTNTFVTILGVYRNGQLVSSGAAAGTDGSSRYSRSGSTVTVYNATTGDFFQIQYTF